MFQGYRCESLSVSLKGVFVKNKKVDKSKSSSELILFKNLIRRVKKKLSKAKQMVGFKS